MQPKFKKKHTNTDSELDPITQNQMYFLQKRSSSPQPVVNQSSKKVPQQKMNQTVVDGVIIEEYAQTMQTSSRASGDRDQKFVVELVDNLMIESNLDPAPQNKDSMRDSFDFELRNLTQFSKLRSSNQFSHISRNSFSQKRRIPTAGNGDIEEEKSLDNTRTTFTPI